MQRLPDEAAEKIIRFAPWPTEKKFDLGRVRQP
jgi:hypothetical protein